MKMKSIFFLCLLFMTITAGAQVTLGTISGYIYESIDSTTTIPFAKVWVETESGKRPAFSNEDGKFKIDALKPGVYNLFVKSVGYDMLTISEITVLGNKIVKVDAYCGHTMEPIKVFVPPIVHSDVPRVEITDKEFKDSPYVRDPKGLLGAKQSDVQVVEGTNQVIIRGSRPGDAIYYIDGVKATDLSAVPGIAIRGLEAYTGGVPAKYGDTTGGVIILETKGYFDLYNAWKYSN